MLLACPSNHHQHNYFPQIYMYIIIIIIIVIIIIIRVPASVNLSPRMNGPLINGECLKPKGQFAQIDKSILGVPSSFFRFFRRNDICAQKQAVSVLGRYVASKSQPGKGNLRCEGFGFLQLLHRVQQIRMLQREVIRCIATSSLEAILDFPSTCHLHEKLQSPS